MYAKRLVRYFHDEALGIEAILCRDSRISYPLHTHVSIFTAGLVLSGAVRFASGGLCRVLGPGQRFLVPPHTPHWIETGGSYSLLCLCVPAGALAGERPEALSSRFRRLLPDAETGGLELLPALWEAFSGYSAPVLPLDIEAEERRLTRFPEEALRVKDLARLSYMSEFHFIRAFHRATGLTPHQFQIQNRVRKGQHLLDGGTAPAEAALAAGFCDQSHFTRHFKRLLGLTPAAYASASGAAGSQSAARKS